MCYKENYIRYNGAGYYDETAYKAMQTMDRGGTSKMENVNRGEIWEMETNNGAREVLVVQTYERYATILMLFDTEQNENDVAIKSRGLMHTDCGRISYCFYDRMNEFVRALSSEEMDSVLYQISLTLDLPADVGAEPGEAYTATPPMQENNSEFVAEASDDEQEVRQMLMDSALELEGVTRERNVYKDLYEQLLNRIVK
ncbi:MAG: hypothetical protein PHS82_03295 [Lachnospiraceae bacterium]|nr:hypothetical protein [Lachnospiraceae bacterium]